jgi:3-hydroxyacyl-[acyl-carrier-protein] dehydratase
VIDLPPIPKILPHRYPFLLVDRVIEIVPGRRIIAVKNVSYNEPFFAGHFPGHPVMPGVLILEALAQASGVLAYTTLAENQEKKVVYLMGIDNARFRKPVVPGDRLQLEVEMMKQRALVWKQKGTAKVDGAIVAEGEFLATIVDRDKTSDPVA